MIHYKLLPTRLRRCEITPHDIDETLKIPDKYLDSRKRETRVYKYLENIMDPL